MNTLLLSFFGQCLSSNSGSNLIPLGQLPDVEQEMLSVYRYAQRLREQIQRMNPLLTADEKIDLYFNFFCFHRDTGIGPLSDAQIRRILLKRRRIPHILTLMLELARSLRESPILSSEKFWDCFFRNVASQYADDADRNSYFIRSWVEIIGRLIHWNGDTKEFCPPAYVWGMIQRIKTDYQFSICIRVLDELKGMSYSSQFGAICVHAALSSIGRPACPNLIFSLMHLLEHRPIAERVKIKLLQQAGGVFRSLAFVEWFFTSLSDEWLVHVFHHWESNYKKFFRQLDYLYVHNPIMFAKFRQDKLSDILFHEHLHLNSVKDRKVTTGPVNWLVVIIWEVLTQFGIPPYFALRYIHGNLTEEDRSMFIFLLSGQNLSRYHDLPIPLTLRQAHYFANFERELIQKPYDLLYYQGDRYHWGYVCCEKRFEDPKSFGRLNLVYGLAWVKCLDELLSRYSGGRCRDSIAARMKDHPRAIQLLALILNLVITRYQLFNWLSILPAFIFKNADAIQLDKLCLVCHYINDHILYNGQEVDFKTKTWHVLLSEAEVWKISRRYGFAENLRYPSCPIRGITLNHGAGVYKIEQICNSFDLFQEAYEMSHCIARYDHRAVTGNCYIFRLVRLEGNKMRFCLTILIEPGAIWRLVDAKGRFNRNPTMEEFWVLSEWLDMSFM